MPELKITDEMVAVGAAAIRVCTCKEGRNQHGYWRVVDDDCPACGRPEAKARAVLEAARVALDSMLAEANRKLAAAKAPLTKIERDLLIDTGRHVYGCCGNDCADHGLPEDAQLRAVEIILRNRAALGGEHEQPKPDRSDAQIDAATREFLGQVFNRG